MSVVSKLFICLYFLKILDVCANKYTNLGNGSFTLVTFVSETVCDSNMQQSTWAI